MAMAPPSSSLLFHCNSFSLHFHVHSQMHYPFFSFFFFFFLSLAFLSFYLHRRCSKTHNNHPHQRGSTRNPQSHDPTILNRFLSHVVDKVHPPPKDDPTRSLLLDVLRSDSAKWASFFEGLDPNPNSSGPNGEREGPGGKKKKKKRKVKKKKMNPVAEDGAQENHGEERANLGSDYGIRPESDCVCPFTSSSSAMQRKIKQHYDELVKCNASKKLTLAQVVQFANSLVDARSELQQKADVIQRKFVITKALLCRADRSSFERLRQQIYKLELEQKRLEEDASVYNWLQHQLKLSPAYKKMVEIGASMEKTKSGELGERRDDVFADISFEELLAQEKKDPFWHKNGKSRLCSS